MNIIHTANPAQGNAQSKADRDPLAVVPSRRLKVLYIEDNEGDRFLFEMFLQGRANRQCLVNFCTDGEEGLRYLRKQPPYQFTVTPDLILLDLNLPRKDGRQVLREIKDDSSIRHIPVLVLSSSASRIDIRDCYELQASCYLQKPSTLDETDRLLGLIDNFWIRTALYPNLTN